MGQDFSQDIRPLLSDRCFACHGPDADRRQADLRLDQEDSVLADRGDYRIIVPHQPQASQLWTRISSADEDSVMPPPNSGVPPLSAVEQSMIYDWIAQGAPWSTHWAYAMPQEHAIPDVDGTHDQAENWIDAFIANPIQKSGGEFSDVADDVTLIRRLSFDLTGLPPRRSDVLALREQGSLGIQRFVDRLLASTAFGERMAVYWLDLVRYADTVGYHGDQDHNISPYRDYVINAFNDNLPWDQFTVEQLAGDLLPQPTQEQIVATGYNRLLQTSHEGGVQPREYLTIYQADRVRNLSAVWMGATVGCAQCHDHKYDPYTAEDFYALAAFFADIDEARHFDVGSDSLPTKRPPEIPVLSRGQRQLQATYESRLEQLLRQSASAAEQRQKIEASLASIDAAARLSMITVAIEPREVRLLPRGNWLDDSGPIMAPSVPQFLQYDFDDIVGDADRANRLHLARWLVDPQRGIGLLTARVFVNRLWMLLFGQGLSRSAEDFGGQGQPPSHPELLDQLALEFVRSGWDVKHMLRLITSSRTYRQSSIPKQWHQEHDPENRLFARQNRFRLPAEMIRDTALAASGLLLQRTGGPSIKPYQPAGYYRHLNFPKREYQATRNEEQWRRGLYVHWQRQFLHPMLRAFDAPMREECTAQRARSNTPLAALVLLNDPSFIEAARGMATRVLLAAQPQDKDSVIIQRLFEMAVSRLPDSYELRQLQDLLMAARNEFSVHPQRAVELLSIGMPTTDRELEDCELAAWTTVAHTVLNLNETYTRN